MRKISIFQGLGGGSERKGHRIEIQTHSTKTFLLQRCSTLKQMAMCAGTFDTNFIITARRIHCH